jgi:hypothetical protein
MQTSICFRAKPMLGIFVAFALWLGSVQAFAAILLVKTGSSGGTRLTTVTAANWTTAAYPDLQSAIDAAQSGDQVWVAAGTYLPAKDPFGSTSPTDNRDKTFYLKNGVKYYGGFAGVETALTERNHRSNQTILSGNLTNDQNANNDAYHVVLAISASSATELNGFVIREGRASANTTITVGIQAQACTLSRAASQ